MSSVPAPDFEAVLEQAKSLPERQRMRLIEALQHLDDDLDPELREELTARARSIYEGTAVLLDGHQAVRELRAKLKS